MTLSDFEALLKAATPSVHHFEAEKAQPPYIVYSEYRKRYDYADNRPQRGIYRVQVEYYTRNRSDPAGGRIESLLTENGIPFTYMMMYDRELRLVHHLYDCEVCFDGPV